MSLGAQELGIWSPCRAEIFQGCILSERVYDKNIFCSEELRLQRSQSVSGQSNNKGFSWEFANTGLHLPWACGHFQAPLRLYRILTEMAPMKMSSKTKIPKQMKNGCHTGEVVDQKEKEDNRRTRSNRVVLRETLSVPKIKM